MRPVPLAVVVRQAELVVLPLSTRARLLLVFTPALLVRVVRMAFPPPSVSIMIVLLVLGVVMSSQERLRPDVCNVRDHPQEPLRVRFSM